jgi:hypothetical protein
MKTNKTRKTPMPDKANRLEVAFEPGKTADRQCAELAAHGLAGNALTLVNFSRPGIGELSLTDCMAVLRGKGDAVNRGDMREAEALLCAQVASLNALYTELARRAALNMGEHLGATETYLRLAMKAQSQCRATIETLADMKNPPVVFARQANISNGPQQVNNGVPTSDAERSAQAHAHAHTGEKQITPTELLQDISDGRTQLDPRATPATGRSDKAMEPVAAMDRPAH